MTDIDPNEAHNLGMDRRITRRDFLNGVAAGIGTTLVVMQNGEPAIAQQPAVPAAAAGSDYYPPTQAGLRGSHPGSFETAHRVRDGAYRAFPSIDVDTREVYDLVIVGGGISGMAAAFFFQNALGTDKKILILDNHDDVGGHAKRNEFHYNGRLFLGVGGTLGIATNYPYSYQAKSLIKEIGIRVDSYSQYVNGGLYKSLGLTRGTFFDKEHFGEDRLVTGEGSIPWLDFFAKTPMSDQAKKDLTRLYTTKTDYLPGLTQEEKRARLSSISYQEYLLKVANVSPDALPYFSGRGYRNNMRVDTVPALVAAFRGAAGFDGLGLTFDRSFKESSYAFHFPDGGASVARLLCKKIVPRSFDGAQNQETIVTARLRYDRLDEADSSVRIRLNSTGCSRSARGKARYRELRRRRHSRAEHARSCRLYEGREEYTAFVAETAFSRATTQSSAFSCPSCRICRKSRWPIRRRFLSFIRACSSATGRRSQRLASRRSARRTCGTRRSVWISPCRLASTSSRNRRMNRRCST